MSSRVAGELAFIVAGGDDFAGPGDDRTDWDIIVSECSACLLEGEAHGCRVARAAARRTRAAKRRPGLAVGLGVFGRVGWAIVAPALLGTALGAWLDRRLAGTASWTLTGMIVGLALGCVSAWAWVRKEVESHDDDG